MYPTIVYGSGRFFVTTRSAVFWLFTVKNSVPSVKTVSLVKDDMKKLVDSEARGLVLAANFSKSGCYLAVCNDFKEVFLYSLTDEPDSDGETSLKLLGTCDTAKKGIKIIFSDDETGFMVADKFGDVSLFSVSDMNAGGKVILGHLSTLLDLCLLRDDKFIVTADRDEKIRVSHYPNTYNIQTFCLGHTSYITCVIQAGSYIVSSSGDGTVKLWDPMAGTLLSSISCEDEDSFVHQLSYDSSNSTVYCLEAFSQKIFELLIQDCKLNPVKSLTLPSPSLGMSAFEDGVVILLDSDSQPLYLVKRAEGDNSSLSAGFDYVNSHLSKNWTLFSGCMAAQREHYGNLSKINIDNIEAVMEKKSKAKRSAEAISPQNKVSKTPA